MLRDDEREAWRGFLAAAPEFAGDTIGSAVDGPDPPDVLCVTRSGKKIGVELTKWVEHGQVASGKARESFEGSYLDIIASANHARPDRTDRIGWVWLHPKPRRVKPEDVPQFREELYEFLARENGLSDPEWEHPQGAPVQDFIGFPVVASYLERLWLFPRRRLEFLPWERTGSGSNVPGEPTHPRGWYKRRWTGSWQRSRTTKTETCTCCMRSTNSTSFATTAAKHFYTTRLRELRDLSLLPSHRE